MCVFSINYFAYIYIYIYIWVNYSMSLTSLIKKKQPSKGMMSSGEQSSDDDFTELS